MEIFADLLNTGTLAAMFRVATPLTLAALGGLLCMRAGLVNIGLEGQMLIGAFFGIFFVDMSGGNVWIGMLGAMFASMVVGALFALFSVNFRANQIITGIAINLLAAGFTSYGLRAVFDQQGSVRPGAIDKLEPVDIPGLGMIPVIGDIFNKQSPITYITLLLVLVMGILIAKTTFGLKVCSVGENPVAAQSAGISPGWVQWQTSIICGALCGIAGAYLSTEIVSQFSENMVAGRGFNAFTAFIFGNANVLATWLVTLLFAFADAVGIRLELLGLGVSPSIIKMFPFILAILALIASSYVNQLRRSGRIRPRGGRGKKAEVVDPDLPGDGTGATVAAVEEDPDAHVVTPSQVDSPIPPATATKDRLGAEPRQE